MPRPTLAVALALALGLCAGAVHAQDVAAAAPGDWASNATNGLVQSVAISGFGTLGAVHSNNRDGDFVTSVLKRSGAGATHPWSADVDTRLGAQLDVTLNRRWSAVLQMVSEQGQDGSYRPRVEWANIKYQVTPELALRAGRIALPMFLTADYRKVGYAYAWVRPPVEGYGSLPIASSDGVDATLRWDLGGVHNASQVLWGHDDLDLSAPYRAYARNLVGLSNTSDWGALSVRVNMIRAEVTTNLAAELFAGFNAFGPAGQALTQRYAVDHKVASINSVGVNYDPGRWFVMAEASRTRTDSLLGATHNAYVSGGWRWLAFTPYATYSRVRATLPTTDPGLPLTGLPPQLAAPAAALNGGLNLILSTIQQQSTVSAGLRWDFHTNMALKLQYDRVEPVDGSRGTLINTTPAFRSGRPFSVGSVTLDFVF